ncbi:hypothetical protein EVAR_40570_1 [Eumeta japonica]|uniref:Uncharacterized protein n=1 Tax=Eumeta variegata TaxID=151549 RepID=A0A4C1VX10_EUMVA|nr:hypothetical protein EVAR_40570_1 [Eumeta japonica]
MVTRNARGVTNKFPASWVGIEYLCSRRGWANGSGSEVAEITYENVLGNVTMSPEQRPANALRLSPSTMIGLPRL